MFLFPSVFIGLAIGLLLGGRIGRLAEVRLRAPWLFYVAIGMQIVAFPSLVLPWSISEQLATALSIGSYFCLSAVLFLNIRLRGLAIAGLGMLMNLAAILANGGHMPALPEAMRGAGLTFDGVHNNSVASSDPNLGWFVDRFAAPSWLPMGNVYSVGDVLIGVGIALTVAAAMGARVTLVRRRGDATPASPG
ncbi:MAG: hypothetical protein QOH74_1126 [Gaiellales bacterium]|jgi:hypothetical protein|nr:hypothetical protein [Gaiellales bacterium]